MQTDPHPATFNLFGLHLPWKTTVVIVLSTLLLITDYYYNPANILFPPAGFAGSVRNTAIEHLVFYLLIPLLVIVFIFREKPSDYGVTIGDWRQGLKWVLISWLIAAPILFFAGRTPDMVEYYARFDRPIGQLMLMDALELVSWEFFFRGFIMFALYRIAGPSAVVLAAVPFALAHLGKPALETLSTIFGGTVFGYVAWRGRSFVYAFLVHWFVMTFTIVVAVAAGR